MAEKDGRKDGDSILQCSYLIYDHGHTHFLVQSNMCLYYSYLFWWAEIRSCTLFGYCNKTPFAKQVSFDFCPSCANVKSCNTFGEVADVVSATFPSWLKSYMLIEWPMLCFSYLCSKICLLAVFWGRFSCQRASHSHKRMTPLRHTSWLKLRLILKKVVCLEHALETSLLLSSTSLGSYSVIQTRDLRRDN